jgi:hypothetical protein
MVELTRSAWEELCRELEGQGAAGEIGLQRKFHDDGPVDGAFRPFERRASGVCIAERYRELAGETLKAVN